jgi:hypothetical protein
MPSWRGIQFKNREKFTFTFNFTFIELTLHVNYIYPAGTREEASSPEDNFSKPKKLIAIF